ncbi:MAG: hypothetical protein U0527_15080 [Candidatus Eisenbacteria bacterium]
MPRSPWRSCRRPHGLLVAMLLAARGAVASSPAAEALLGEAREAAAEEHLTAIAAYREAIAIDLGGS